jgi:hypothetical protein
MWCKNIKKLNIFYLIFIREVKNVLKIFHLLAKQALKIKKSVEENELHHVALIYRGSGKL